MTTPRELAEELEHELEPHPEGGRFRRVWTSAAVIETETGRRAASAIHYLLDEGEVSAWHRVTDAEELWQRLAGAPLELRLSPDGLREEIVIVRDAPVAVPAGWWQSARSLGSHSLALCTVAPEFRFESFELAPPCWSPGAGPPA